MVLPIILCQCVSTSFTIKELHVRTMTGDMKLSKAQKPLKPTYGPPRMADSVTRPQGIP